MRQVLDGSILLRMFVHASASLGEQKQVINELNVFPVPDGDTGTNMSMTVGTAAAELKKKNPQTVGEVAGVAANAMLRGARGNSGVILSLLFRGFAKSVKELDTVDGAALAQALTAGVSAAYKAVMKPAEGTMLTVSRLASVRAQSAATENASVEYVLEQTVLEAEVALADTINLNPVLQKAGVIDAGGMGYVLILKGMLQEIQGVPLPEETEPLAVQKPQSAAQKFSTEEIKYGYCTEFICSRDNIRDPNALRAFLDGLGDSLVLVDDDEIIKVHVHTNNPGKALEEALRYGALLTVKVENMREQHTEILEAQAHEPEAAPPVPADDPEPEETVAVPEKKYGFVVVCAGEGLRALFEELGADGIIQGGQTMNPSTQDILRQINETPAEIVYVLPNNKNIILAAQQTVQLVEGKQVIVLPSSTVPQGLTAMLCMDRDKEEAENTRAMEQAMSAVTTLEVTYAARDSEFDGITIHRGDYLALKDNHMFGNRKNLEELLEQIAGEVSGAEFINIFYGEDVNLSQAEETAERFRKAAPEAEVVLVSGGQPVYSYLISAE